MFSFAKRFFSPAANPIGVDFGSDALRMAQVRLDGGTCHLLAAASADVPSHVRHDPAARLSFFTQTARDLLAQGNFSGRNAVLALPAACMFIQHLRIAKMDEDQTAKALVWEARGKLPIDPSAALMRHIIAGEVYQDQELRHEVILMAAARDGVHRLLDAAARARLQVVGMNIEPKALLACFGHLHNARESADDAATCYVDMGCVGTRVMIALGQQILFARGVPIGGDHFTRAVADSMKIGFDDAKMLRIRLASQLRDGPVAGGQTDSMMSPSEAAVDAPSQDSALLRVALHAGGYCESGAAIADAATLQRTACAARNGAAAPHAPESLPAAQMQAAEDACREPLARLTEELDLCRRYYEATFPSKPVDRLVFVGGEARQRALCQRIAQELGIAAQVGDPLVRLARAPELAAAVDDGIDRTQPQPAWAVAIGLSLGPIAATRPPQREG